MDALAGTLELAGGDLRLGELAFQILHGPVERRLHGLVALDLQNQVNAALEVESEPERFAR